MESQIQSSKRAPRELQNWRVQGNPPTLRQPFVLVNLCSLDIKGGNELFDHT